MGDRGAVKSTNTKCGTIYTYCMHCGYGLRAVDHNRTSIYWCARFLKPRCAAPAPLKLNTHECQVTRDVTPRIYYTVQSSTLSVYLNKNKPDWQVNIRIYYDSHFHLTTS